MLSTFFDKGNKTCIHTFGHLYEREFKFLVLYIICYEVYVACKLISEVADTQYANFNDLDIELIF